MKAALMFVAISATVLALSTLSLWLILRFFAMV